MRVMAIVAHPDDEVLGLGGTLARHVREGDDVFVVVACANSFRGPEDWEEQAAASMATLGIQRFALFGWPDQLLHTREFGAMVQRLTDAFQSFSPDLLYTHWHQDLNRDHRLINEAVQVIARPRGQRLEIREFYTPSSSEYSRHEFHPDTWVDISDTLDQKVRAMECYPGDVQPENLPRNGYYLKALAVAEGGKVGLWAAECFETVRRVL